MPNETPAREIVLAATDFTPASDDAIRQAWLRATGAPEVELHLVHVTDEVHREGEEGRRERLARLHHAATVQVRRQVEAQGLPALAHPLTVHVRVGEPAAAILQLAADLDADLLVVGSHGKSGVAHWFGSVARKLLETAQLPMLIARPKAIDEMRESAQLTPPCPDCVATRRATGGARFWCDLHGREHVHVHGHASTQRVTFAKPSADSGSLYA